MASASVVAADALVEPFSVMNWLSCLDVEFGVIVRTSSCVMFAFRSCLRIVLACLIRLSSVVEVVLRSMMN